MIPAVERLPPRAWSRAAGDGFRHHEVPPCHRGSPSAWACPHDRHSDAGMGPEIRPWAGTPNQHCRLRGAASTSPCTHPPRSGGLVRDPAGRLGLRTWTLAIRFNLSYLGARSRDWRRGCFTSANTDFRASCWQRGLLESYSRWWPTASVSAAMANSVPGSFWLLVASGTMFLLGLGFISVKGRERFRRVGMRLASDFPALPVGRLLLYAVWFALLTGVTEVLIIAVEKHALGMVHGHLSEHYLWMTPLSVLVVYLAVTTVVVLAALTLGLPMLASLPFLVFVWSCLFVRSGLEALGIYWKLHSIAALIFIAGASAQTSRWLSKSRSGSDVVVRRSLPVLAAPGHPSRHSHHHVPSTP